MTLLNYNLNKTWFELFSAFLYQEFLPLKTCYCWWKLRKYDLGFQPIRSNCCVIPRAEYWPMTQSEVNIQPEGQHMLQLEVQWVTIVTVFIFSFWLTLDFWTYVSFRFYRVRTTQGLTKLSDPHTSPLSTIPLSSMIADNRLSLEKNKILAFFSLAPVLVLIDR